jgi:hypothetical protein
LKKGPLSISVFFNAKTLDYPLIIKRFRFLDTLSISVF